MKTKSLREYDRLADRIRQHRQVDKSPVIITEGPSDVRLLSNAFRQKWQYFPASTRSIALDAAKTLHEWRFARWACVVDRDFDDEVAGLERLGIPLHPYENADLEAMLSVTDAYTNFLSEFASAEKLEKWGGASAVMRAVHDAVAPITILRRANVENSWGLKFDDIDLSSKIDNRNLKLKVQPYCDALSGTVGNSPNQATLLEYANGSRELVQEPICPRGSTPYFRGKDFLCITGVALRSAIGSHKKEVTAADYLSRSLRLAGSGVIADSSWGRELIENLSR
ncbi:hypothetical protein AB0K21_00430 [Streptosporangium sp. NPDC049248]|uniref:hypothetical protein n=1 Tax=Streptosporangium sp. NPDC049248 TaxID=3155651 RepID=UPI00342992C2